MGGGELSGWVEGMCYAHDQYLSLQREGGALRLSLENTPVTIYVEGNTIRLRLAWVPCMGKRM